jgi:hypothetical protein
VEEERRRRGKKRNSLAFSGGCSGNEQLQDEVFGVGPVSGSMGFQR